MSTLKYANTIASDTMKEVEESKEGIGRRRGWEDISEPLWYSLKFWELAFHSAVIVKDLGSVTKRSEAFLMYASLVSELFRVRVKIHIPELPNTHTEPESQGFVLRTCILSTILSDSMEFAHHFQI